MERSRGSRAIGAWLIATFALIGVLVVVGGATRLTGSGLSMVDWSPLGAAPPGSAAEWGTLYDEYRASPQFQQVNHWMTLDDFKGIFWWEYVHRQLGRLVGLVYGLPFLWFLFRGRLSRELVWRGWIGLGLGGLQGLVGWWMVKSGLVSRPEVSHYRLAVHLSLALLAGMWILWMWLGTRPAERPRDPVSARVPWIFTGVVSLQIVWGAFMAGKKAGWRYDTWPDMDGAFIPEGALGSLADLVEDGDTIHWVHRTLGWVVLVSAVWLWTRLRRVARGPANAVLWLTLLQFGLGVATVMASIPVTLGVAHQFGAFCLLSVAIWGAHSCSSRPPSSAP